MIVYTNYNIIDEWNKIFKEWECGLMDRMSVPTGFSNISTGKKKPTGFKNVQASIASKQGVSKKAAGAILASVTRKASGAAKKANPNLKKVK